MGKRARREAAATEPRLLAPARLLPPHRLVLAPMVGGSELPFRLLARRHGAQLCYTPMLYSSRFVSDAAYRSAELRSADGDSPLVAHFCGNDADVLLSAGRLAAAAGVCAIDINLGCPQRIAHSGNFGSHLCATPEGRAAVLRIVAHLSASLPVPVFCKVRLCDELDDTLCFARQLKAAGCALLAVHARFRGSATRRRDGPADLEAVRLIKQAVGDLPVLTNGNVACAADVVVALRLTGADGCMSAEGALDDPALFARAALESRLQRRRLKKAAKRAAAGVEAEQAEALLSAHPRLPQPDEGYEPPTRAALALEYLRLVDEHAGSSDAACARFHVRRMLRAELAACALGPALDAASSLAHVGAVARRCAGAELSAADAAALAELQLEAECGRRNAAARLEYEKRLQRKAKREGREADFYVAQGAAPPSEADVAALRAMDAGLRVAWWSARFGQHCMALHGEGSCARAKGPHGCAFLHKAAATPSWLNEKEET